MSCSPVIIVGASPVGFTTADKLKKETIKPRIFEQASRLGKISCAEACQGYHFDVGSHHYFTEFDEVNPIYQEVLNDEFTRLPSNKAFDHPRFGLSNPNHSMLMAMLAARKTLGADHNMWNANVDRAHPKPSTDEARSWRQRPERVMSISLQSPMTPATLASRAA